MKNKKLTKTQVLSLKYDCIAPCDFIRAYGIKAFKRLPNKAFMEREKIKLVNRMWLADNFYSLY